MSGADALLREYAEPLAHADALIFDCDGTLVHSGPVYEAAWAEGLALAGRTMAPQWYRARSGLSESVLLDAFEAEHGVTLDREAIVERMRRAFLDRLRDVREVDLVCALARKHHAVLPMAVASGGPAAIVVPTLAALELLALFDAVVTVDDTGEPKPSPAIFREAARRLNTAPGDCLVFEDSDQGLEAARRGGFPCVDVRPFL